PPRAHTTEHNTLSLHDALPIWSAGSLPCPSGHSTLMTAAPVRRAKTSQIMGRCLEGKDRAGKRFALASGRRAPSPPPPDRKGAEDRKSTRLNSSHVKTSYAVFC